MQAVTAVRFGLKPYDVNPFDGSRKHGYLGMSHVQNLNVWFDQDGVTIRPTLSEADQRKTWSLGMRLEAYGYGGQLMAAPPIVSQKVKDNRIEYERTDCRLPLADCRFERLATAIPPDRGVQRSTSLQLAIGHWQSAITEGTKTAPKASEGASRSRRHQSAHGPQMSRCG
jgi:hypothetical protein